VVVSEHDIAYDETVRVVNTARAKGVPVTLRLWKYMCHAWIGLSGFVPEGQQAVDFVCDWYCQLQQAGLTLSPAQYVRQRVISEPLCGR
jgi:acetyl esterase/lipase